MVLDMELKTPYMILDMVPKIQQKKLNTATKWRLSNPVSQMLKIMILDFFSKKSLRSLICYLRHRIRSLIWFPRLRKMPKTLQLNEGFSVH